MIEDAAQAHGALHDPARSAATAYSFYPTKNLGGIGDGGAVVTNDAALAELVRTLRVHGMTTQYVHERVSQNFRMSEIEAAWLRLALPELTADVDRRRRDRRSLPAGCASTCAGKSGTPTMPTISLCFAAQTAHQHAAALEAAGVASAVHYPLAITQQPAYRDLDHASCPEAEAWAAECISVPCFPEMTEAEIDQCVQRSGGTRSMTACQERVGRLSRATTTQRRSEVWSTTCLRRCRRSSPMSR